MPRSMDVLILGSDNLRIGPASLSLPGVPVPVGICSAAIEVELINPASASLHSYSGVQVTK